MADDGATRTRRYKLHKAGDHSLCKPGCGKNPQVPRGLAVVTAVPASSAGNLDTRAAMVKLAERLEGAHEADPANAMVARELRVTLQALSGQAPPREDDVDRIRREWEQVRDGP